MSQSLVSSLKKAVKKALYRTPLRLSSKHRNVDTRALSELEQSIRDNYLTGWRGKDKYSPDGYERDLRAHLQSRLDEDRHTVVPWLDRAGNLAGKRILEIGCGTGSSTVALAEQGAKVTGIDLDAGALAVAKDRLRLYGLDSRVLCLNSLEMLDTFGTQAFDTIIFFACLEHMTIAERLSSLRDAWAMLPQGGQMVVVETPNRLWYFDEHTAWLPFFHWLPNELAFQYAKFSKRENFQHMYTEYTSEAKEHFLRRGRGISFHEFDLAIGPSKDLKVLSSLGQFQGLRYELGRSRLNRSYRSLLMKIHPGIHRGFFEDNLDLIIEKP
jgi:2-polyprenyl-3-methyl-5-hydroxy-6-metoxy-1,4-benzoquinol methylase